MLLFCFCLYKMHNKIFLFSYFFYLFILVLNCKKNNINVVFF